MRIIVLFNLKHGTDPAAYEAWARAREMPGVRALPSIDDFQVYRTTGLLGSDGTPAYAYAQIIDVADMDGFASDSAKQTRADVAREFGDWADAPVFMLTDAISMA